MTNGNKAFHLENRHTWAVDLRNDSDCSELFVGNILTGN